jgi:uncharacterized protein YegP (UPF0339 family)
MVIIEKNLSTGKYRFRVKTDKGGREIIESKQYRDKTSVYDAIDSLKKSLDVIREDDSVKIQASYWN